MNIPNFMDIPVIQKGGMLSDEWRAILEQLILQLQLNIGTEGFSVSQLTTAKINLLANAPNGTIVYDTDLDLFKGRIAGVWKTFTLT